MNTDKLNVGDTAYASMGRYGQIIVKRGVVVRKSPTGTTAVEFANGDQKSFKPNGFQRGASSYDAAHLITADDFDRMTLQQQAQQRVRAIHDGFKAMHGMSISRDTKDELLAGLRDLIAKVEAL